VLKVFLLHVPNGLVPAAGFAPETEIVKLRPFDVHYKICTGCFTADEWFMTFKKKELGVIFTTQ